MSKRKITKLNQAGTALLMTVLILNTIIVISLAAAKLIISGVKMSGTQAKSTKAYFAAESGAEQALWRWRQEGWNPVGCDDNDVCHDTLLNNSTYQVICTSTPVKIRSAGSFGGIKRTVEVELDF
jgi:Tfp pilus assembly protein PilX